jgi:transposase
VRQTPLPEVYAFRKECLATWEALAHQGAIDLFYADESRVSLTPYVPYAWQFKDEQVAMPSDCGSGVNCFALLTRDNRCRFRLTERSITSAFVIAELEALSLSLVRPSVVILDNAGMHRAGALVACFERWQARGLFVAYLPAYSPHLNIVETLWRKLKYEWLRPSDYADKGTLHLAVWQALAAVGTTLAIQFSRFSMT